MKFCWGINWLVDINCEDVAGHFDQEADDFISEILFKKKKQANKRQIKR
jgi:hypothetical protein